MPKGAVFVCEACGHQASQWSGRCAGCGAWGEIKERPAAAPRSGRRPEGVVPLIDPGASDPARLDTRLPDLDRVLGGGLVPGSVILLAGPPGIGKSTLLLHWLAAMAGAGCPGLLASGEESRAQVAARARRIGVAADAVSFAPGRDLQEVLAAARAERPTVLAVDSIQTLRDPDATTQPGGVAQVRGCVDALVELAKTDDVTVVVSGHVTKDGDLAGPRALEHAVDVVLAFEGDPRSGLRIVSGGKNRFGAEGETAWFEMGPAGLSPIDPSGLLRSGERHPGAAVALPLAGRRALAVEVQALVGGDEGSSRRQVTGLDLRRFQQVAAVLERAIGLPLGRSELFGAVGGGIRVDDPASDLAVAAALASAATGQPPPEEAAFVGEIALTGQVRRAPAREQRLAAARAAGCSVLFGPEAPGSLDGLRVVPVGHLSEALGWAVSPAGTVQRRRAS
jgi:DNA repair protein RadA/Sms